MNNNGRQTHAHRTPESVSPHTAQRTGQTSAPQRKNSANTGGRNSGDYVFRAGDARHQSTALRAQQRITSLTPEERKKIQKRERREVEEREREKKWQNEVVRVRGRIDVFMLVIILVLLALGSITVFSASYPLAVSEGKASNYYIIKQLQFVGIGGFLMLLEIFLVPVDFYKKKFVVFTAYFVSMALLIYTFFRGNAQGEAVRWVRIGPVNVQPSELMKVSLVLMLAWYADKYRRQMKELNLGGTSYLYNIGFPVLILGGDAGFVLIGKHLSGTIIIGAIAFFMMIIAGCKITWLLETLIPVGAAGIGLFLLKNPYALKRITTFTDENADKLDELYQTTQSLYAIGSGGLFGVGLGKQTEIQLSHAGSHGLHLLDMVRGMGLYRSGGAYHTVYTVRLARIRYRDESAGQIYHAYRVRYYYTCRTSGVPQYVRRVRSYHEYRNHTTLLLVRRLFACRFDDGNGNTSVDIKTVLQKKIRYRA